jgi:hypothetical protein
LIHVRDSIRGEANRNMRIPNQRSTAPAFTTAAVRLRFAQGWKWVNVPRAIHLQYCQCSNRCRFGWLLEFIVVHAGLDELR